MPLQASNKMKIIFIALIFVAVAARADARKKCFPLPTPVVDPPPPVPVCSKAHEIYSDCGTACPLSCDKPEVQICKKICVSGCFCETGYVRNKNGDCILAKDCPKVVVDPPTCPKNEVYSECGANACQSTCSYTTNTACRPTCIPGCICEEGYARNSNGDCILLEECPQIN